MHTKNTKKRKITKNAKTTEAESERNQGMEQITGKNK